MTLFYICISITGFFQQGQTTETIPIQILRGQTTKQPSAGIFLLLKFNCINKTNCVPSITSWQLSPFGLPSRVSYFQINIKRP